jgi:hypothetical protein
MNARLYDLRLGFTADIFAPISDARLILTSDEFRDYPERELRDRDADADQRDRHRGKCGAHNRQETSGHGTLSQDRQS